METSGNKENRTYQESANAADHRNGTAAGETVQEFTAALQELNWFRYCESTNVLGTKSESK
jgi:hypothetical protein